MRVVIAGLSHVHRQRARRSHFQSSSIVLIVARHVSNNSNLQRRLVYSKHCLQYLVLQGMSGHYHEHCSMQRSARSSL